MSKLTIFLFVAASACYWFSGGLAVGLFALGIIFEIAAWISAFTSKKDS